MSSYFARLGLCAHVACAALSSLARRLRRMMNHASRPAATTAATAPPTAPPIIAPRLELELLFTPAAVVWDDEDAVAGVEAPEDGFLVTKIVVGTVVTPAAEPVEIKFELRITTTFVTVPDDAPEATPESRVGLG